VDSFWNRAEVAADWKPKLQAASETERLFRIKRCLTFVRQTPTGGVSALPTENTENCFFRLVGLPSRMQSQEQTKVCL